MYINEIEIYGYFYNSVRFLIYLVKIQVFYNQHFMAKITTSVNNPNDALFILIKSLTKSEKRQFNLYVGRLGGNIDAKFFSLFKFLEKLKVYDEKVIIKSGIVSKQQ